MPLALAVAAPLSAATLDNTLSVGFYEPPESLEVLGLDSLPSMKGDIYYGVGTTLAYDSNLYLTDVSPTSDWSLGLRPWVMYTTDPDGEARTSIEAMYAPSFSYFLDNSDLNTTRHTASGSIAFRGTKATVRAYLNYAQFASPDRVAGTYVEGSVFSYGLRGDYKIAPRTKLNASLRLANSDYGTAGQVGSDVSMGQIGFTWEKSPLLNLGASVRYAVYESGLTGERTTLAVLGHLNYEVTDRISLTTSLGVRNSEDSRPGGDAGSRLTGALKLAYHMDARWSFAGSVRYVTAPSTGATNYVVNDLSIDANVTRHLDVGQLRAGVTWSQSDYSATGATTMQISNDRNLAFYANYGHPFFSDRVAFTTGVSYATNSGYRHWSRWMLTAGWSVQF